MNSPLKPFSALFDGARKTLTYAVEGVVIDFTEQVLARMEAIGVARSELAEKLGSSSAYVTKLLRGGKNNFTLESMVKVAHALDTEIKVELIPKAQPYTWLATFNNSMPPRNKEAHAWSLLKERQTTPGTAQGSGGTFLDQESQNEVVSTSA